MADAETATSGAGVDAVEVLDLVAGLVRKSMVVVTTTDGQTRYGMLESLRAYARERLIEVGEEDEYRDRFARCFFDLVDGLERDITGPGQAVAYATIRSEFDNIRATLDWFVSRRQADRALRLVRVLRTYLAEYRPTEGFRWALDAVAIGDAAAPRDLAGGLADAAWIGYMGERAEALSLARRSVEVSEAAGLDPDPEALRPLALEAMYAGDMEASLRYFERATAVARQADDLLEVAAAQTGVCFLRTLVGDREGAVEAGEEAVALGRLAGFDTQIAGGLAALGFAFGGVDAERSATLLEESLDLKGDTTYSAVAKAVLAHLRLLLGQLPQALHLFRQVLDVHRTFGDRFFVPMSLEGMASIFALAGHPASAARMLGGAEVAREKLELPGLEIELALRAGAEALVEESLEPEVYRAECERGRTWTLEETIEFGLAEAASLPGLDLREAPERDAMVSVRGGSRPKREPVRPVRS
jgi:tetratricopeptide (TPR) repeat protein